MMSSYYLLMRNDLEQSITFKNMNDLWQDRSIRGCSCEILRLGIWFSNSCKLQFLILERSFGQTGSTHI